MRKKLYIFITSLVCIGAVITACQAPRPQREMSPPTQLIATISSSTPTPKETVTMQMNIVLTELKGTKGPIYSLAWSPDGKMLASGGFAKIRIWDTNSLQEIQALEDPRSFVWGVAWLPDSSSLAAASQDGVWVWTDIHEAAAKKMDDSASLCVSWSPAPTSLASGDPSGKLSIWDTKSGRLIKVFEGTSAIIGVAWSPMGDLVAAGDQSGQIHLYRVSTWEEVDASVLNSKTDRDVNGLAWSSDGSLLAAARQNGTVLVWDSKTDKILFVLERHQGWARGLAWSLDGKELASVGQDGMLKIWNIENGKLIQEQKMASDPLWSVAWSPDGERIAVGTGIYRNKNAESSILIWSP